MELPFQLIADDPQGGQLEPAFAQYWPSYKRWINRAESQRFSVCLAQLRRHMPELIPIFESLHARFGGTDEVGRFLTLYNPPRLVRACTQTMLDTDAGPVLLRSYDHHPGLVDAIVLRSAWSGTHTLAMTDCIWGALDGINAHGLAIALAFGGRNELGDGFSPTIISRYVLETCVDVADARRVLDRLPVYMPYTFAVLDARGNYVTAFLAPDANATFVTRRCSTNHQGAVRWAEYARFVETAERLDRVERIVEPNASVERARAVFLSPPVWRTQYANASGTIYVAEYAVEERTLTLHWPGRSERVELSERGGRVIVASLPEPAPG